MTIDEQGLRRRLEDTASETSAPRFTADGVARQVRRRRARVITAVCGAAAAAAAVAVAVPVALSGSSQQPSVSLPPPPVPSPSYTVTVNGQTEVHRQPRYVISPGEDLAITVDVTVPAHVTVTGLWLGITNGVLSPRPDGPASMSPILAARTGTRLLPGVHRFRLHWVVPGGLRPGASRQLSAEWAWAGGQWPPGSAEGIIAGLGVQGASGT
jgi:hypothetical protein